MNCFLKNIRSDFQWIIFLSILVLLPNIYLVSVGSDLSGGLLKKIIYLITSILIFLIPSLFLKARTFFLFHGIFVLLAPIEIAHIYLSKMPISFGFLMAIFDTNMGEAMEVLSSIKIILFFIFVLWVVYFFIVIKKIKNEYFITSVKSRLIILVGLFLFFCCGFGYYYHLVKKTLTDKDYLFEEAASVFSLKFRKIYPCDIIIIGKNVWDEKLNIKNKQSKLKDFSFHATCSKSIEGKEMYFFIIGETARYDNFSINGYNVKTTPLLEKTDHLISYSDFYSEANLTSFSLPLILTRASAQDRDRFNYEKSFVDAFKEAGFKTYWIANQSAESSFIRRISKDTDGEFFSSTDFDAYNNFDEKLWVNLNKILSKNEDKVLVVFHTLGSHFRYNFRYPLQYEVFKPSFEGAFDYSLISLENKEKFINTYNNSILYTDYFLANTIRKLDSLNVTSALVYTSDHGENLFDTKENVVLHANVITTKYDFHVPLIIWTSQKYREINEDKINNLYANKDKKLSSSNIFYSILDMANISFPEQNLKKSFASEFLLEDSVRYYYNIDRQVKKIPE